MQPLGRALIGRRMVRGRWLGWLRFAALGGSEWGLELFRDEKTPNDQFINLEPTDAGSTDRQSTDGDCTDGDGTHCDRAQQEATYRQGAGCHCTDGPCAGARRLQFASEGVP